MCIRDSNQLYSCSATARNANGSGPASATVNVTPLLNAPLALNSVWSRKNHPVAGVQEIQIDTNVPLGGLVTVEPRLIGAGHQIVFRFNNTVTAVASSAVTTGSATHTINGLFGACVTIPGTGLIANNYMHNFDPHPARVLSIAPGKRVFSSMAPMMVVEDGRVSLALGLHTYIEADDGSTLSS